MPSILGSIVDALKADDTIVAAAPGGIWAGFIPPSTNTWPAIVVTLPQTDFDFGTSGQWQEHPKVMLHVVSTSGALSESLGRACYNLLLEASLPDWPENYVQCLVEDFTVARDDVGARNFMVLPTTDVVLFSTAKFDYWFTQGGE